MQKILLQAIVFIIVSDSLIYYEIFLPLRVKQCEIITYKHGIYELPHELSNHLRLKEIRIY